MRGITTIVVVAALFYVLLSAVTARAYPFFHEADGGWREADAGRTQRLP